MKTVRDVCKYIGNIVGGGPYCIETGCTYTANEDTLIHTTTNNIVEYVCVPNNGMLASVDIDPEHIEYAKTLIPDHLNYVNFCMGDSLEVLGNLVKQVSKVDFLCLDSKEFDEDFALHEFQIVEPFLVPGRHFVLVDDIHNDNSVKWKKVVPYLKDTGYSFVEVPTPTGLFVAAKGYSVPNG